LRYVSVAAPNSLLVIEVICIDRVTVMYDID